MRVRAFEILSCQILELRASMLLRENVIANDHKSTIYFELILGISSCDREAGRKRDSKVRLTLSVS